MVVQCLRGLRPAAANGSDVVGADGGADDMDTDIQRKRAAEEQCKRETPEDDVIMDAGV